MISLAIILLASSGVTSSVPAAEKNLDVCMHREGGRIFTQPKTPEQIADIVVAKCETERRAYIAAVDVQYSNKTFARSVSSERIARFRRQLVLAVEIARSPNPPR